MEARAFATIKSLLDIDLIISFHIGIFYRKTWLATFRGIKRDTKDAVKRLNVKGGSQDRVGASGRLVKCHHCRFAPLEKISDGSAIIETPLDLQFGPLALASEYCERYR